MCIYPAGRTGESIGGTPLNSNEKIDAFIDVVPGIISGGLTETGAVVKTTEKGLKGFNEFVKIKGLSSSEGLPKSLKWQENASKLYKANKISQQGLTDFGNGLKVTGVSNAIKNETNKKK